MDLLAAQAARVWLLFSLKNLMCKCTAWGKTSLISTVWVIKTVTMRAGGWYHNCQLVGAVVVVKWLVGSAEKCWVWFQQPPNFSAENLPFLILAGICPLRKRMADTKKNLAMVLLEEQIIKVLGLEYLFRFALKMDHLWSNGSGRSKLEEFKKVLYLPPFQRTRCKKHCNNI